MVPKALQDGDFDRGSVLKRKAMEWTYILRNRSRWTSVDSTKQEERAVRDLEEFGFHHDALEAIARDRVVEVSIPYRSEAELWEARIFPWEYVIAGATRELRHHQPFTVMRCLSGVSSGRISSSADRVLYVESAPAELRDSFGFETEQQVIRVGLRVQEPKLLYKIDPTLHDLKQAVRDFKPKIVHIAGFDSHQGLELLKKAGNKDAQSIDDELDGYLLRSEDGKPDPVSAVELAKALCSGGTPPTLVSFNLQNSAARIAPLTVAAGAGAALGFQDVFDDSLGEQFFATFYRLWRHHKGDLQVAFRQAWEDIRAHSGAVLGSGMVLWSSRPLVRAGTVPTRGRKAAISSKPTGLMTPDSVSREKLERVIKVEIEVPEEINYSLLHNREPLFKTFTVMNHSSLQDARDQLSTLADLDISVRLSTGTEEAVFEKRVNVDTSALDLKKDIHVPLTSDLMRSSHESINSSLFAEVTWGSHVVYRDSHRVRLIPVDQWRDNNRDGKWLPSFVLPRDPAVTDLIERAQRYVRVLRDDPSSGFDGYQSVENETPEGCSEIDRQVQAIWSYIVHDLGLGYVNPPPGYSVNLDSQRLRTPSMVVKNRCGTCIDLAILFAACLELVDIYPVIFLLKDHAFPGYWRSDAFQEKFMRMADTDFVTEDIATEDSGRTLVAGAQRVAWWPRASAYDEIKREVQMGRLVPLETVWLTSYTGFWDAVDGGKDNLKSRCNFDSMLDIARAREAHVTPLPIGGAR